MNERMLLLFSVLYILWTCFVIVVPYVRRQYDLLTTRNFFLLGGMIFIGISGINAANIEVYPHYFQYSSKVFYWYYVGVIVFMTSFMLSYKRLKWPTRAAMRQFRSWPRMEGIGLWFPLAVAMSIAATQIALVQIPGVAALMRVAGMVAPIFAMVFALAMWNKGKMNPLAIAMVAFVLATGAYLAFRVGGGRRPLYGLVAAAPICFYWWRMRYWNPWKTLAVFAALAVMVPIGDAAYRAARWMGTRGEGEVEAAKGASLRWSIFVDALLHRGDSFQSKTTGIGQNSVENSLCATYIFKESLGSFPLFKVKPFHSLYVIATLPIPRAIWEDKPRPLGITMPYDSHVLKIETSKTNWGPGIVAHGFHDGGLLVLIIYGILAGGALKYCDTLLALHPGNPFLMGFLSAASVQVAGWLRGDIATMTPIAAYCFVFMAALAWLTRFAAGKELAWRQSAFGPRRQYVR